MFRLCVSQRRINCSDVSRWSSKQVTYIKRRGVNKVAGGYLKSRMGQFKLKHNRCTSPGLIWRRLWALRPEGAPLWPVQDAGCCHGSGRWQDFPRTALHASKVGRCVQLERSHLQRVSQNLPNALTSTSKNEVKQEAPSSFCSHHCLRDPDSSSGETERTERWCKVIASAPSISSSLTSGAAFPGLMNIWWAFAASSACFTTWVCTTTTAVERLLQQPSFHPGLPDLPEEGQGTHVFVFFIYIYKFSPFYSYKHVHISAPRQCTHLCGLECFDCAQLKRRAFLKQAPPISDCASIMAV